MGTQRNEIEVEWQFETHDLRAVAARLASGPIHRKFAVRLRPTLRLFDVYFDTRELDLLRAGFVLRVRSTRTLRTPRMPRGPARLEATLKSLTPQVDGLSRRREIREALPLRGRVSPSSLDRMLAAVRTAGGPVGTRVRALLGARAIRPLFTLDTERRRYGVRCFAPAVPAGRARAGEIALDRVRVRGRRSRRVNEVLQRVEIEIPPEMEARFAPFVSGLVAECALLRPSSPKFAAGLRAENHRFEPLELGPTEVSLGACADELAYAALRRAGCEFLKREPLVRLGEDPEDLHRMRVASRRLRAGLSFFREVLPSSAQTLRAELRGTARALGAVRDLDVLASALLEGPASMRSSVWIRRASAERRVRHQALLAHFDSRSQRRVRASLIRFLRAGKGSRAAATPGLVLLVRRFERRRELLRRATRRLTPTAPAEAFHRARILTKRLRYAIESGPKLESRDGRRYLRQLIRIQDALGALQDSNAAILWFRGVRSRSGASARVWIAHFERRRAQAMRSTLRRLGKLDARGARAVTRELERLATKRGAS